MTIYLAASKCANGDNVLKVECKSDAMVITVDEDCRRDFYPFIEWKKSFITGTDTIFQDDPTNSLAVAPCTPIGTSATAFQ